MSLQRWRDARVARSVLTHLVALVAAYAILAPSVLAGPTGCPPRLRPQDAVWLVSSRTLGCCDVEAKCERLQYWRYDREQSWVESNLAELTATDDPQVVTTVFIHGNRIPSCEAFTKGWSTYRALVRCAGDRPVRFIIWSWPSDRACGPVNDARIKAARTNCDGYYLAWFLGQLHNDVPVSLWGHSFGARIATGALHLLAGGKLCGRQLDAPADPPRHIHAVLLAAAVDDDWLLPGHTHALALSQVDAMLLVNNSCDRLLKRYRLLYHRRSCQQALGYVGLALSCLSPDDADKVSQIDACCQVGKQHLLANYLASPNLLARMRANLLFEVEPTVDTAPAAGAEIEPASSDEPVATLSSD